MMARGNDVVYMAEYIKNVLYFATVREDKEISSTVDSHYFCIDNELVYENYYQDFGPLNLGCVYKYCELLRQKLRSFLNKQVIVHYASADPKKAANAAFLMGCYGVLYLGYTPKDAMKPLTMNGLHTYRPFQDAVQGDSTYTITILDCLKGIKKAHDLGFFDFKDFNYKEYERLDKIAGGDLNWIVPGKFLAFIGPVDFNVSLYHPPEMYIDYFLENDVKIVIRLNKRLYDGNIFKNVGIYHHDLFFADGTCPPRHILFKFLQISEDSECAIAVHCKAGLGRTGSLIGSYLIKHYRMTAREAIAWMRICRPGSVIGAQQGWLEQMEKWLIKQGDLFRKKRYKDSGRIPTHANGIYSFAKKNSRNNAVFIEKAKNSPPPIQRFIRLDVSPTPRPKASRFREEDVTEKSSNVRATPLQSDRQIKNNISSVDDADSLYPVELDEDSSLRVCESCMWHFAVRCANIIPKKCQSIWLCLCLHGIHNVYFFGAALNKTQENQWSVRTPKDDFQEILNKRDQNERSRSISRRGSGAGEPRISNSSSKGSTNRLFQGRGNANNKPVNSTRQNANNNDTFVRSVKGSRPIPVSLSPVRPTVFDSRNSQTRGTDPKRSGLKNERLSSTNQAFTVTPHNSYRVPTVAMLRDRTPSSFSTTASKGSSNRAPSRRLGRSPSPSPSPSPSRIRPSPSRAQPSAGAQSRPNTPTGSSRTFAKEGSKSSLKKAISRLKVVIPRDDSTGAQSFGAASFGAASLGARRAAPAPAAQRAPRVRSDERAIATQGDLLNSIKFQRRLRENNSIDDKINKNFHEKFSIPKNTNTTKVVSKWSGNDKNSNTAKLRNRNTPQEKPIPSKSKLSPTRSSSSKGRNNNVFNPYY